MDIRIITTIEKIGEVDFLVDDFEKINVLPIEVKSGKESFSFKAMTKLLVVEGYRMNQGIILSNDANVYEKDHILYLVFNNEKMVWKSTVFF